MIPLSASFRDSIPAKFDDHADIIKDSHAQN
jgi:hypothetical protein